MKTSQPPTQVRRLLIEHCIPADSPLNPPPSPTPSLSFTRLGPKNEGHFLLQNMPLLGILTMISGLLGSPWSCP